MKKITTHYLPVCSVCDRITFATWARRNRTALSPSRENGHEAWLRPPAGHFLRSGFGAGIAKLRHFQAIFRGMQPGFSATQTEWRRTQSGANPSPQEFPANREIYRECLYFGSQITARNPYRAHFSMVVTKTALKRTGIFLKLSGNAAP
jgi:hypothetical protein